MMEEVTDKVTRQYAAHPYPPPAEDLTALVAAGVRDLIDPSVAAELYWPEGPPRAELDILVAGCGTQQAAFIAYTNPGARVVGVDLSEASLGHQRHLRERHNLTNLHLYQGDLRKVGDIGRSFDLIISTGVLHHMADPSEGLCALRSVLAPRGAMGLMVYRQAGRPGIYTLQDAFRRMGLGQAPEDIRVVRQVLASLRPDHPIQAYVRMAGELQHDAALVDTFLHPQDRAFSVPELLAWLEENGLAHQAWMQNQFYYPEGLIPPAVRRIVRTLPEPDQWATVEALNPLVGNHIFTARRPEDVRLIDFTGEAWHSYRPAFRHQVAIQEVRPDGTGLLGLPGLRFEMTAAEIAAGHEVDGVRSIGEILALPTFAHGDPAQRMAFGRICFERFWKIGVAMFRI